MEQPEHSTNKRQWREHRTIYSPKSIDGKEIEMLKQVYVRSYQCPPEDITHRFERIMTLEDLDKNSGAGARDPTDEGFVTGATHINSESSNDANCVWFKIFLKCLRPKQDYPEGVIPPKDPELQIVEREIYKQKVLVPTEIIRRVEHLKQWQREQEEIDRKAKSARPVVTEIK